MNPSDRPASSATPPRPQQLCNLNAEGGRKTLDVVD
jgi:hypothetical protein